MSFHDVVIILSGLYFFQSQTELHSIGASNSDTGSDVSLLHDQLLLDSDDDMVNVQLLDKVFCKN